MAHAEQEKIERLRDRMLVCPICMEEYKDPRILTCHHTVCLSCLMNYVHASSSSGRLFRCPTCRADVCVPRGGVKDFPPNFYINCIQDEIGPATYFGSCQVCDRDWLLAQYACVPCNLDLCKFCVHDHRLFQHLVGREPNIMRIQTGNLAQSLTSERFCQTHKDESLQMFCVTCNVPLCVTCICDSHKRHETITLNKKLHVSRTKLQADLDKLQFGVKEVKSTMTKIHEVEKEEDRSADDAIAMVQDSAKVICDAVTALAKCQVDKIEASRGKHVKELREYETELANYLEKLQRGTSFLGSLQEEDMSLELITCFEKYQHLLESTERSVVNKTIPQNCLSFTPGKVLNKYGYLAIGRSILKNEEQTNIFLKRAKVHRGLNKYAHMCLNFVSVRGIVAILVVLFVLVGLVQLGSLLCNNEDASAENIVCASLYVYLCVAAVMAYRKSW